MIAGFAGLAALIGISYTARTYRVTEQGHITDRYTKAIDQLGSAQLDVRLGGLYALERIAVDSTRDHPTVVEVLGAYVRQHTDPTRRRRRGPAAVQDGPPPQPAVDVQAAITVLGRLPSRHGVSRGDLAGAHLTRAELFGADLTGARLDRANLIRANLVGARLIGADLATAEGLTQQQLDSARGNAETKLPTGRQRPARWSVGPAAPPAADP